MGKNKNSYSVKAYIKNGELHIDGIEVSHPSKVNKNYRIYPNAKQKVSTFTKPYNKPVLAFHDSWKIIGYVLSASYRRKSHIDPELDAIVTNIVITDDKAIENFKRKLYRTFSVGMERQEAKCSICGKNIDDCEHEPGEYYDGKLCYTKAYIGDYLELSAVAVPADEMAFIPIETLANLSDDKISLDTLKNIEEDDIIHDMININYADVDEGIIDENVSIKIQDEYENKENGGNNMPKLEDLIDQVTSLGIGKDFLDVFLADFSEENKLELLQQLSEMLTKYDNDPDFFENYSWDNGIDMQLFESGALDDNDEDEEDKQVAPAGSKARNKMKTTFCGPNKTFPIPDCKHAATALAMLRWPKVAAKYKGQISKIRACIYRVGKKLGCPFTKTKSNANSESEPINDANTPKDKDFYEILIDYGKKVKEVEDLEDEYKKVKEMYDAAASENKKLRSIIDNIFDDIDSDKKNADEIASAIENLEVEKLQNIFDSLIAGGVDESDMDDNSDEHEDGPDDTEVYNKDEGKKYDPNSNEVSALLTSILEQKAKE